MRMRPYLLAALGLILGLALAPNASARPIVADLALHSVDIDHNFTGLDILMFGARNDPGIIVAAVRGPKQRYIVRKKSRIGGIWVNTDAVEFEQVDSFYSLASSRPLADIRNPTLLTQLGLALDHPGIVPTKAYRDTPLPTINAFHRALLEHKQQQSLFPSEVGSISFWGETLFRTILPFPKNISRGWYNAETYLFSDGTLSAMQSTPIEVRKIGLEAKIFDMAHARSALYGLLCILLAFVSGWGASTLFGRVQGV